MPDPIEEAMSVVAADTLLRKLTHIHFGQPISHGALGLVPLYDEPSDGRATHIPLPLALGAGLVHIVEQPIATVPTLKLISKAHIPVLIIDGDELVGGLQNRVANTSLLIPTSCEFDLPVSCVEQGRWSEAMSEFSSGETAYPSLRARKIEDVGRAYADSAVPVAEQSNVWAEVACGHRRSGTRSGTGAMRDTYEQRHEPPRQLWRLQSLRATGAEYTNPLPLAGQATGGTSMELAPFELRSAT